MSIETACKADHGKLARHETYMTKVFCTELGFRAADRCMQIHGGMGLTTELPIHKMWRDSRSFMITEGAVEVMRMVLARADLPDVSVSGRRPPHGLIIVSRPLTSAAVIACGMYL